MGRAGPWLHSSICFGRDIQPSLLDAPYKDEWAGEEEGGRGAECFSNKDGVRKMEGGGVWESCV